VSPSAYRRLTVLCSARGVQQFHLFDFERSAATSELMLPWIEAGIVIFHTLTYEGEETNPG
jgi:hypothetical protein